MDEFTIIAAYEFGEITDDEFVSLEAYISETSKSTKDKRDELIAKDHGINLKNKSKASYKALADAKHKDRSSEYERDSDGVRYKNHDPYDRPSIEKGYFDWDKNHDIVSRERYIPKTAKGQLVSDLMNNPAMAGKNEALDRQLSKKPNVNSMPDVDDSFLKTIYKLKNKATLGSKGDVNINITQDELMTDKKRRLNDRTLGSRHDKNIPDGDREEINRRKEDEYDLGRKAASRDDHKKFVYSPSEVLNKGRSYDRRAKELRKNMSNHGLHPADEALIREVNRYDWGYPIEQKDKAIKKYITRKLNLINEIRAEEEAKKAAKAEEAKKIQEEIDKYKNELKSLDELLKEAIKDARDKKK